MAIRLSAGSADIRGNKGDCNAKFAAAPHRRCMVLVEYPTQRIHRKLGELESQFTRNFRSTYKRPVSLEEVKACVQKKGETLRSYIQRWSIIKNSAEDVSDERAIDAFLTGLRRSDLVEEIGRTRPTTVAELMEQANKFTDGEDAYNNKRGLLPEVDRISRQRRQHRSRDNQGRRNQVAVGYVLEEEEGYGSRRFQAKGVEKSKYSGPSAEDMLYGPRRIRYAYLDGKRVSNHQMKDCRTFLRLESAMGSSQEGRQGERHRSQGYQMQRLARNLKSKVYMSGMIQPVPKSKKERKSISRQVNLAISSPPATTEYLRWSEQPVKFSRADHPRKVPRPGHSPMVLKAQIGGYDIGRVFMDAGSGINLIYARTLKAMCISLTSLKPTDCSFHGIVLGAANYPLGRIELDVCFGSRRNYRREKLEFEVMDWPSQYHAILGCLAFAKFMAVPHYAYLMLKIPGPKGTITVQGSFEVANICDREFNRMAQTFGMTAEYERLKGETDHNMLPDVGRSLPDQAFDTTQDSEKIQVHPTDPNKTTSIAVNLDPA
jgi:hypothetical protein